MLQLNYFCQLCGDKMPKNHDSMLCNCGGEFRPDGTKFKTHVSNFKPGWCPTLKQMVYSFSDQERKARKFRSPAHPMGFVMANDNHQFIKKCKKIVKDREEIIQKTYAEDGIKYKKGSNCHWSDEKQTFINRDTKEPIGKKTYSTTKVPLRVSEKIKKVAAVLVFLLITVSNAYATNLKDIEGLRWIPVTVNGKTYDVPEHKEEFYGPKVEYWLKAIDGDQYAKTYLLGNKKEVVLFMGDGEKMRWLHLTKDKVWVVE